MNGFYISPRRDFSKSYAKQLDRQMELPRFDSVRINVDPQQGLRFYSGKEDGGWLFFRIPLTLHMEIQMAEFMRNLLLFQQNKEINPEYHEIIEDFLTTKNYRLLADEKTITSAVNFHSQSNGYNYILLVDKNTDFLDIDHINWILKRKVFL